MSRFPLESELMQDAEPKTRDAAGAEALALSADEFAALEERIRRAVSLLKQERQSRAAAEERASKAEAQLRGQEPRVAQLEKELGALRAERDHVRQRVEKLLAQLDALEL